jgi:hypothetical protein
MPENPNAALTGAPLIGQFQGPQHNAPRKPAPNLQRNPEAKKEVEEDLPAENDTVDKAKSYLEQLRDFGLPVEKARMIRDNMLFNHYHEEDYLLGNKLPITIRTRDYADVQRAMRRLEAASLQYPIAVSDMIAQCNMAASLRRYGTTVFEIKTVRDGATVEEVENAFEKRLNFILGLSTTLVDKLMVQVQKFDMMISAVFADGAPEDF